MSQIAVTQAMMFDPQFRNDGLGRLDLLDWDEINSAIQAALSELDESVQLQVPGSRVQFGNNRSEAWDLFSYRVYQPPEHVSVDPVVVGIQLSTDEFTVHMHADICGESLGDILAEVADRFVIGKIAVIEAARDMSAELRCRTDVVADALRSGRRTVD